MRADRKSVDKHVHIALSVHADGEMVPCAVDDRSVEVHARRTHVLGVVNQEMVEGREVTEPHAPPRAGVVRGGVLRDDRLQSGGARSEREDERDDGRAAHRNMRSIPHAGDAGIVCRRVHETRRVARRRRGDRAGDERRVHEEIDRRDDGGCARQRGEVRRRRPHDERQRQARHPDRRDERGYLRVDEHLRVAGEERVFAIGVAGLQ